MAIGTGGQDTLTYDGSSDADETIDALGGDDTIIVSGQSLGYLSQVTVTVLGGAGTDSLSVSGYRFSMALSGTGHGTISLVPWNENHIRIDYDSIERFVLAGSLIGSIATADGDDALDIRATNGNALVSTAGGNDTVLINTYYGSNVRGGDGDDLLSGGVGDSRYLNAYVDRLFGEAGNDRLAGGFGDDRLDGGTGADFMAGGLGNDIFYIDDTGDTITEAAGEGFDRAYTSVSWTITADVHLDWLSLAGSSAIDAVGNALDNTIIGNSAENRLEGGDGNDRLEGFGGSRDTLVGGNGNDLYFVSNDDVIEEPGGGIDTVLAGYSYVLGAHLENLELLGTQALSGLGNELDNALIGNSGINTLYGLAGNDQLDGGTGADRLVGGDGDDRYFVDNAGDLVVETSPGGGRDSVYSALDWALGAHVEWLFLTGSAVTAVGNELANALTGNGGNNLLDGGAGADVMNGGRGNDTYVVDNAGDRVIDGGDGFGNDTIRSSVTLYLSDSYEIETLTLTGTVSINASGNRYANTLNGNSAANVLNGGAGGDVMAGGDGDDLYYVDDLSDRVVESSLAGGTDTVISTVSFELGPQQIENLVLSGTAATWAIGNNKDNDLIGSGAANSLFGRLGNDVLVGGAGDDNLHGGGGHDNLRGGAGSDGFYFDTAPSAASNVDRILDFDVLADTIYLDRSTFTGIPANGPLHAGGFREGTSAQDADDRILYDAATGNIYYDSDGSGADAAILFAQVTAGTALTAIDFSGFMA